MTRFPDWQLRLQAFVASRSARPFEWGSNDCAVFAADAVEAITGTRLLADLRGYASADEALSVIEAAGGLHAVASSALGEPVSPKLANVGDVVLLPTERAAFPHALAVCNGGTAIGPGPLGFVAVSMRLALHAWKVG